MHPVKHTLLLALSIIAVYAWLQVPTLQTYSLQVFAILILLFLGLKRLKNAKAWHILPERTSVEMVILTFAFLLLIGSTGNMDSIFYPLTYIHLFFLVMTTAAGTAIFVTIMVMLFHFGMAPIIEVRDIAQLINLPIMLLFFLFAKQQYDEVLLEKQLLAEQDAASDHLEERIEELEAQLHNASSFPDHAHEQPPAQPAE